MIFGLLADGVLMLHFAFIAFVMTGGIAALRWPRVVWFHLPAFGWGAVVELAGWPCPLTPLEQWLRWRAGEVGYSGDFISHYLLALIYPEAASRPMQIILGVLVLVWNGYWYWRLWRRSAR